MFKLESIAIVVPQSTLNFCMAAVAQLSELGLVYKSWKVEEHARIEDV